MNFFHDNRPFMIMFDKQQIAVTERPDKPNRKSVKPISKVCCAIQSVGIMKWAIQMRLYQPEN